jgi:hypothetical protein
MFPSSRSATPASPPTPKTSPPSATHSGARLLSQARALYTRPTVTSGVVKLRAQPGWHLAPHFHFGHMQRGFCWTTAERDVDEYVDLWTTEIHAARAVPREEWDEYWDWLEEERIASPEDRPEFNRHFTDTQRQSASPRPGMELSRRWPLAEAEALDSRGALHAQVREALNAALVAFGEPPLSAPASVATGAGARAPAPAG